MSDIDLEGLARALMIYFGVMAFLSFGGLACVIAGAWKHKKGLTITGVIFLVFAALMFANLLALSYS